MEEKTRRFIRRSLLVVMNGIPLLVTLVSYSAGGNAILFYPVFVLFFVVVNYYIERTTWIMVLLDVWLFAAAVGGAALSGYLYYHRISSDIETILVSAVLTIGVAMFTDLAVLGGIIAAYYREKSRMAVVFMGIGGVFLVASIAYVWISGLA